MAKSGNPFFDMDFTQVMDPAKLAEQYRLPGFDPQEVMTAQRKNLEAIAAANRVAVEGAQAIARRQADILRRTMEEASAAVQELSQSGAPEERAVKQAEIAKRAFETAIANMRELAEMSAKAQTEAMDQINGRVAESLDEVRRLLDGLAKDVKAAKK